jgi:diadenosine tetraphosphatase ApaH/serine/threonine PP2A family protein phosphatase
MGILFQETNVLLLKSPINICGDIHGQFDDLLYLFAEARAMGERPNRHSCFTPQRFLFMGDYVDRGHHSLNTFLYLVCLKLQFPDWIYLLRGNHESRVTSSRYGFSYEIILNYGHSGIWALCNEVFDLLPVAAVIDNRVFCVHGGLSPALPFVANIATLNRVMEIPEEGPLADLTWSDPEAVDRWRQNTRGAGYLFGSREVEQFTHNNRIEFICRSHQLAMNGFVTYFEDRDTSQYRLITIWSAPNYTYRSGNRAAIMKYGFSDLDDPRHLIIFDPNPDRIEPRPEESPVGQQYFS